MRCRAGCGACCIAPSITQPFYGMPQGKKAGESCVHLDEDKRCAIFHDVRRPDCCAQFQAEEDFCGGNADEAISLLTSLEQATC